MSLFEIIKMSWIFEISVLCLCCTCTITVPVLLILANPHSLPVHVQYCSKLTRICSVPVLRFSKNFRTRTVFRTHFKNFTRIPSLHFPYLGCTKGRNAESVSAPWSLISPLIQKMLHPRAHLIPKMFPLHLIKKLFQKR